MNRQRNYAVEYRRRIQRGVARGLTRAQAAGHPKLGEPLAANVGRLTKATKEINLAISNMRNGDSLRAAARDAGVSEQRLRRFLQRRNMAVRKGNQWHIHDLRPREVPVLSDGRLIVAKTDLKEAQIAGYGWDVQGRARNTHDLDLLEELEGKGVTDVSGHFHPFETDPNTLLRLAATEDDAFYEVYQILG